MKETITLILIFIYSLTVYCQDDLTIQLRYQKNEDNTVWTKGIDKLTVKNNNKVVGDFITDTTGMTIIPETLINKYADLDIFLTSIGVDTNYLVTITKQSSDSVLILLPKQYKGKFAKCPKCGKSDKVYQTIYGLEQIVTMNIVDGDTVYSPMIDRKYYMGSCIYHEFNPKFYCDRDGIFY